MEPPLAIAALLLFARDLDRLATFYREALGLPLVAVDLPDMERHWACELRHVYFSIWPHRDGGAGGGAAFYVKDVYLAFDEMVARGVPVEFPPRRSALGIIARLRDPEGNPFELYEPPR